MRSTAELATPAVKAAFNRLPMPSIERVLTVTPQALSPWHCSGWHWWHSLVAAAKATIPA